LIMTNKVVHVHPCVPAEILAPCVFDKGFIMDHLFGQIPRADLKFRLSMGRGLEAKQEGRQT